MLRGMVLFCIGLGDGCAGLSMCFCWSKPEEMHTGAPMSCFGVNHTSDDCDDDGVDGGGGCAYDHYHGGGTRNP